MTELLGMFLLVLVVVSVPLLSMLFAASTGVTHESACRKCYRTGVRRKKCSRTGCRVD